jgi:hypothetical protein
MAGSTRKAAKALATTAATARIDRAMTQDEAESDPAFGLVVGADS